MEVVQLESEEVLASAYSILGFQLLPNFYLGL